MSATTKRKKTEAKAKPVSHVQVGGVRIPIWENHGEDGTYFKAGQPELSYRGNDDEWHAAKSYGARDLVNLIKASSLAHSELLLRSRAARENAEESGDPGDGA